MRYEQDLGFVLCFVLCSILTTTNNQITREHHGCVLDHPQKPTMGT